MNFLIESMEHTVGNHKAWWRPERLGYTTDVIEAGRYSYEDAKAICEKAGKENEKIWGEADVLAGKAGKIRFVVMSERL